RTTGEHAHEQSLVLADGCGDGTAVLSRVGSHTEHPLPLRLGTDRGIDLGVVGARDRVPPLGEVTVAVATLPPPDLSGVGERSHRRGGLRCDQFDHGSRGDQPRQSALGDTATTDNDDASTGQVEAGKVMLLYWHARNYARPAVPSVSQGGDNVSISALATDFSAS